MKTCKQCLGEIPDKARKCSHCGSKQPSKIIMAAVIILAVLFAFMAFNTGSSDKRPQASVQQPVVAQPRIKDVTEQKVTVESVEFDHMQGALNVWRSYDDRTLIDKVERGEQVTLMAYDAKNDYCGVRTDRKKEGWFSCGWIKDLPSDLR